MLKFYDFVIFGMFAIVLGKTFFPREGSPVLQALSAFTIFAVGYFARPFGGIIFGHIIIQGAAIGGEIPSAVVFVSKSHY